ncbi:hypothetical protein DFH07DRAFT_47449 [Mycena maculata]|uniref:Uncharacterized protein n=1 Tax=Mycena maculata TaxID=230809 RepID=A0AAD7K1Z2_9AGAR|nr:hypothetical protein DFH07DRAFT_47449 [Mycena maculata]
METPCKVTVFKRRLQGNPNVRAGKPELSDPEYFQEFRGRGKPPSLDSGQPGDIYWDVTDPYIFYVREHNDQWAPWNSDPSKARRLAEHPVFLDRYLWISMKEDQAQGLTWLTRDTLKNSYSVYTTSTYAITGPIKEKLASLLQRETTQDEKSRKRKREDLDYCERRSAPKQWDSPTNIAQIPDTVTGMAAVMEQIATMATAFSHSATATVPAVQKVVDGQTETLIEVAKEVEDLRKENAKCK